MRLGLFFIGALAAAQPFSFGVKAGVPLTNIVDTVQTTTNLYIISPTVELRVPFGLAIEADALYPTWTPVSPGIL